MPARRSARILVLAAALTAPRALALDCHATEALIVVPGTYDAVAPRNTHVFVSYRYRTPFENVELVELESAKPVATRVVSQAREPRSRQHIELAPLAPLAADRRYAVMADGEKGRRELATFAVANEVDQEPPRMGLVREATHVAGGMQGGQHARVAFDALVDDHTSDGSLRLLLWEQQAGPTPPAEGLHLVMDFRPPPSQSFTIARGADCEEDNFDFPQDFTARRYLVALADAAGNVSEARPVTFKKDEMVRGAATTPSALHHVPGIGLVRRGMLITGASTAVVVLALSLLLRRRRRA